MSISAARRSRRPTRRSLTLEQIVDAALGIVREHGLDALSMSRLADELGVGVMTIYGYTRNKDDLLDALTVRVVEDMYDDHIDLDQVPWDQELRTHYAAVRQSLLRHPGLADLLFLRDQAFEFHNRARDRVLGHVERHVSSLRAAGFSADDAVRYFYGLSYWTVAFVVRESIPDASEALAEPDGTARASTWVGGLPPEFTTLREAGDALATLASDAQFLLFLDTFLAGMRARLDGT